MHEVIWIKPGTEPESVICAEMPRGPTMNDNLVQVLREMVKKYQIHNCSKRCLMGAKGDTLAACKYGFPGPLRDEEAVDQHGVRWLYVRREGEDRWVVPFNLEIMLLTDCHTNLQRVTGSVF